MICNLQKHKFNIIKNMIEKENFILFMKSKASFLMIKKNNHKYLMIKNQSFDQWKFILYGSNGSTKV